MQTSLPLTGTVFTGYLEEKNDFSVSTYTFYKAEALPDRLAVGLEQEYKEFMDKQGAVHFVAADISSIETIDNDDFDIDFDELGISLDVDSNTKDNKKSDDLADIDLSDIDLSLFED